MKMKKLLFGTAGIPISTESHSTENGIKQIRKLGLDALEMEFVRGIYLSREKAPQIKSLALKNNVVLSAHAPYYINLNSPERYKIEASKKRILDTARIAYLCGAWSIVFHSGFYLNMEKKKVYNNIKKNLQEIIETLKSEKVNIWVRPETMGKKSQFGNLNELLQLSSEVENVMPCIDFAHLHARTKKMNTYDEFYDILSSVEKKLGKRGLENIHAHISGIEYGDKGERYHLTLKDSDFRYKELIKALKDFNIRGVIISESPNIEQDALMLKKLFFM